MLILFHCLSLLIFQLLRNRKRIKLLQKIQDRTTNLEINSPKNENDVEFTFRFDPPVFRQRYGKVYETLLEERWRTQIRKLIDFGCAELGMFVFLKHLTCVNNMFFVDIDEATLNQHMMKLRPLTIDYLKRRNEPLDVSVFVGSVADPDYRLLNTDAVTAVELIEHLYPDVLDAFSYNIFNFIEPKIVIITTPNADFNVLFSNDSKRFRHFDHKFEWSREQFEDWANNIVVRFPDYTVSFSGIGDGPFGSDHLGQCSQMAVFIRKDILEENYVSRIYATPCFCNSESPCKGVTSESKMKCNCICPLCSPNASYGICTYYSYSKQIISYEIEEHEEQNPAYNIYYKLIEKIKYPFEYDLRSEEEKLIDMFKYRINTLGRVWGRFYVEEKNRSEIPLSDLLYGPDWCSISESELHKLLTKYGYQIEECRIQEIGQDLTCVIYEPEMEEISSTSEASGYDSDFTKYQLNEESLSDWDDSVVKKKETNKPNESYGTSRDVTCSEGTSRENQLEIPTDVEDEKKQQDSLFDSGYQKSLSLLDDSPQTPLEDLEESDLFEETTSTPSLSSEDNKVHLKRASTLERHTFIPPPPPPPDINKLKLDVHRINELDKYHNITSGKTLFNHFLKPQSEVHRRSFPKDRDSLPGPSNVQSKKRKKIKKSSSAEVDDDSPLEDVKSITNCILENTLNRIDIHDIIDERNDLIQYNEAELEVLPPVPAIEAPQEPVLIVENGDLANNNRDIEGNNYIAAEEVEDVVVNDFVNDNLEINEELPQPQEEIANFDNNNQHNELLQVIEDPPMIIAEAENVENAENVVARASREAVIDPNSERDSLNDFEIPPPLAEAEIVDVINLCNNIVLIGVHPTATPEDFQSGNQNDFPHWLLQILGNQAATVAEEGAPGSPEEPHYYCQGDGLGVHPSVIAVEIDEEEDEESTDSTNNTTDFAEVDQGPSSQDMSSLPDDSQVVLETQNTLPETQDEEERPTPEQEEYFDSSSSTDTGIGTNKSS